VKYIYEVFKMTQEGNKNQVQEESDNVTKMQKALAEERSRVASSEQMKLLMNEHIRFKGLCEELAYMLKEYYILKSIKRSSNNITIEFLNGKKFNYTITPCHD